MGALRRRSARNVVVVLVAAVASALPAAATEASPSLPTAGRQADPAVEALAESLAAGAPDLTPGVATPVASDPDLLAAAEAASATATAPRTTPAPTGPVGSVSPADALADVAALEAELGSALPGPPPDAVAAAGPGVGTGLSGDVAAAAIGLTATPTTGLVDGTPITATATGLPADAYVAIALCPAGELAVDRCVVTYEGVGWTEGDTFAAIVPARTLLPAADGTVDCREEGACVIAVGLYDGAAGETRVAASVPLAYDPAAAPAPLPALTVTPAAGLHDLDEVTVAVTGLPAGTFAIVEQCAATPFGEYPSCDWESSSYGVAAPDGTLTATLPVSVLLPGPGQPVDCRTPQACVIGVRWGDTPATTTVASIAFAADAEPAPRPAVTVTPATGLVDGQVVDVAASGLVPGTYVSVFQCTGVPIDDGGAWCEWLGEAVPVAPDGTVATRVGVQARFARGSDGSDGRHDCRRPEATCQVGVGRSSYSLRSGFAPVVFAPDGPLLPDPSIAVDGPTEGLAEGATVTVTGRHFRPLAPVTVDICTMTADPFGGACANAGSVAIAGEDGTFAVPIVVEAAFSAWGPTGEIDVDCRQEPGCALVATYDDVDGTAPVPIAFGPPPPARGRWYDPVFDEVEVDLDVPYRSTTDHHGSPVELHMDIYRPVGDTATERPVALWMHGGYFIFGDKADMADYATEFARRGYVGISLQYRLRPDIATDDIVGIIDASYDAYDDATAAVAWLREHAAEYGIDPDAIAAGGYSAGGMTSFGLAYLPGNYPGPATSQVQAALPIAGAVTGTPEPGEPPVMPFHGTIDTIVTIENARSSCAYARSIGLTCDFVEYGGAGHEIVSTRQRDIVRRSVDFLATNLLAARGYLDGLEADAGGPYEVVEGSGVSLAGRLADVDGEAVAGATFAWTPADRLDDPTSATPTYTGADDGTETLTLTATAPAGGPTGPGSATASTQVTTTNAAPEIRDLAVPAGPGPAATATLSATIADPGTADSHTVAVDWGDGTSESLPVTPGAGLAGTHAYPAPGAYDVTVTVADDDGGTGTATASVTVGCTVRGGEGEDDVLVGGRRDDVLCGLGGNDLLVGGPGDDVLLGGPGDDWLLGGPGRDRLVGGPGHDVGVDVAGRNVCEVEAGWCRRARS